MKEGPSETVSDYHDHDAPHDRPGGRLRRIQYNWHEGGGFSKKRVKHEFDREGNRTSVETD